MIKIIGKDKTSVNVIARFSALQGTCYVLSDFIKSYFFDERHLEVGWFHVNKVLEDGEYMLMPGHNGRYYLRCNTGQSISIDVSNVTNDIYSDMYTGACECIMKINRELKAKDSRIAEIEADLELYKSTQEFIEECKKM